MFERIVFPTITYGVIVLAIYTGAIFGMRISFWILDKIAELIDSFR